MHLRFLSQMTRMALAGFSSVQFSYFTVPTRAHPSTGVKGSRSRHAFTIASSASVRYNVKRMSTVYGYSVCGVLCALCLGASEPAFGPRFAESRCGAKSQFQITDIDRMHMLKMQARSEMT